MADPRYRNGRYIKEDHLKESSDSDSSQEDSDSNVPYGGPMQVPTYARPNHTSAEDTTRMYGRRHSAIFRPLDTVPLCGEPVAIRDDAKSQQGYRESAVLKDLGPNVPEVNFQTLYFGSQNPPRDLDESKAAVRAQESIIRQLQQRLQDLQGENAELQSKLGSLKGDNANLRRYNAHLESRNSQLETENNGLKRPSSGRK